MLRFVGRRTALALGICSVLAAISKQGIATACIHDEIAHKLSTSQQEYGDNHPFELAARRRRRRLEDGADIELGGIPLIGVQEYDRVMSAQVDDASYQSIRITPFYDAESINALSQEKRDILYKIVPDAIDRFTRILSVVPVQGNLMASRSCDIQWLTQPIVCKTFVQDETCLEMRMPDDHFGPAKSCSTCTGKACSSGTCSTTQGSGVANSDFVLYIRAAASTYCSGSVLAYASSCQKDQYDRPTFGMANFCPNQIRTDPYQYQSQLSTAMHEITHALGFSAQFFPFMRNDDGTPRTQRNADGDPAWSSNVNCANGQRAGYYMPPGASTVQFTNERDTTVARMVTPRVAAFAKSHFGCDDLTGAEVENQDDGCLGSHWEERIFEPEYMTPISSFRNVLSPLTLAFFEDSGWYKTNASMAERLNFGAKRGCAFAKNKCVDRSSGTSVAEDHYCTNNDAERCTVDATSRSVCSITSGISGIPAAYQYFSDPARGGNNEYADYCPINTGFKSGDCSLANNLIYPTGTTLNILGETYCPTCKCTATSLRSSDSSKWVVNSRRQTGCYSMFCPTEQTVEIRVPAVGSSGQTITVKCSRKGEQLKVNGYSGTLTCPDPSVVCQRSCPAACSGNGVCNFATAICACNKGWKGDDCATDSTVTTTQTTVRRSDASAFASSTSIKAMAVAVAVVAALN